MMEDITNILRALVRPIIVTDLHDVGMHAHVVKTRLYSNNGTLF